MSKLPHFYLEDYCYFITTTTEGRNPVFADDKYALILWDVINNQRKRNRFYLLGFVIMPDHLHLVVVPRGGIKTSFIMQEIKKGGARLINRSRKWKGKLWMKEYYDYVIRDEADLVEKINYIHYNPVNKGLVENEEEYSFSSANPQYEQFIFSG